MTDMTNAGLKVMGYFVWWSIHDVKIAREEFNATAKAVGLDKDLPELQPRSVFLKAVREVKKSAQRDGLLIRKISKQADKYTFGLVDEQIDTQAKTLGYTHSATMTFSPNTGNVECDQPHRAFGAVKRLYEEFSEKITSDDVRAYVLDVISTRWSISVRARGGIYYLPDSAADVIEKLEMLLYTIGGDCFFAVAPQIDAEKSRMSIMRAFLDDMRSKIATFRDEIEEKKDSDGKRKQVKCWKDRIEEFTALKEQVTFYADALKFNGDALVDDLTTLQHDVNQAFLAG